MYEVARHGEWDRGWEEHERRQRRRQARLSLAEKLEWLEEAQRLADFLASQLPKKRPDETGGG